MESEKSEEEMAAVAEEAAADEFRRRAVERARELAQQGRSEDDQTGVGPT